MAVKLVTLSFHLKSSAYGTELNIEAFSIESCFETHGRHRNLLLLTVLINNQDIAIIECVYIHEC